VAPGGTEWQISICDCAGTDDHPHCGGSGGGAEQDNENEEAEQDDTPSQEPSVTNPDCSDTECSYRGTCYDNNQKPADYWCCNGEWSSEKCAAIRAVEEENTNQEELSNEYSDDGTGSECDPDGDWPQCDGSNTNSKTCNNGYVEWTTCTSGCNPDTGNCNPSQAPECNHRNYTDQCTSDGNVKKCNLNGQFVISNCQGGCHNGDCQNGVDLDPTDQTENHGPGRGSINKFITKTLAATYTVDDNIILTPTQDGVYNIDIPGEGSATNVKLSADEPYFFYVDENGNDQQDENEEAIDLNQYSVELEVSDDIELFEIELSQGLNYISFEYLPDNTDSCKLIKEINDETDVLVTMISRFESGDFESTSFREDTDDPVSGACFPVIPGRGYVIRALEEPTDSVGLQGYKLLAPAEVSFDSPGWHLIGVNGNGKSYTADSLIDSIDELNEEIDADNVTRWEKSRDMYLGLQKETTEEGEENVYGFDFPIKSKTAYFVRTISGAGVWTPE
jgi:hypothetical protein